MTDMSEVREETLRLTPDERRELSEQLWVDDSDSLRTALAAYLVGDAPESDVVERVERLTVEGRRNIAQSCFDHQEQGEERFARWFEVVGRLSAISAVEAEEQAIREKRLEDDADSRVDIVEDAHGVRHPENEPQDPERPF
jgi:hypothetical protein